MTSDKDIVRVRTLMVGDEYELIVPKALADMLELNGKTERPAFDKPLTLPEIAAGYGILMVENAIGPQACAQLVAHARQQGRYRSGLINYDNNNEKIMDSFVDYNVRDTYNISVEAIKDALLKPMFFQLIAKYVEPFFSMPIEWWEQPQLLFYTDGGKYEPHVDADYWIINPDGTAGWKKISDRDVSILLYLNDDFEGGELQFPDYNFRFKPKPGMFVAFPSGKDYRHGAMPTLSGERFVLVSWAAAEGVAKVQPQPPKFPVVYMKDLRNNP